MKIEIGTRVLDNQGHSGIVERIAKSPEVLQKYPNGLYYVSHSIDDYGYKTNTDGWYLPEKLIPLYKCLTAKQVSKINKAYINGDAVALDEISLALQENHFEEDSTEMKLLDFCYHLNYLLIETETNSYASDYNCEILGAYSRAKSDLFEKIMPKEIADAILEGNGFSIEDYFDVESFGRDLRLNYSYDDSMPETAGEYWCSNEYATDEEIGQAYIDECGFDSITTEELERYFDYEQYGTEVLYGEIAVIINEYGHQEILDYGDEIDVNYYNSLELYEIVEADIGNNDAKELVNVGIDELNEGYEDMEL